MSLPLVIFKDERHANLLANHLVAEHIPAFVSTRESEFIVSIENASDAERAKVLCHAYIAQPANRMYQQQAWASESIPASNEKAQWDFSALVNLLYHVPLTALILVMCIVVFVGRYTGFWPPIANNLMMLPLPDLFARLELWRLIGPSLIHFSLLHIVFNLLWWAIAGGQIERKLGKRALITVFILASITTSLSQTMVSGPNFGGLSGVVYAVVGFVWWMQWLAPQKGLYLPPPVIGFMLVWLLVGYADVLWVSMANTAHTVGLITGCALAWFHARPAQSTDNSHHP